MSFEWERPKSEVEARGLMLEAEKNREYSDAALAALACADFVSVRTSEGAASYERQAQVYATLHLADVIEYKDL